MEIKRVELHIPTQFLKEIEKYQKENHIKTRSSAILELIRRGLQK